MLRHLLITLTLIAAAAAAAPSIPDHLPATTSLLLGTPNAAALRADIEHTPLWGLWQEPSVQGFFRPLRDTIQSEMGQNMIPVDMESFLNLFDGQIWFGLSDIQAAPSEVGPFFIGETDQPEQVMAQIEQAITQMGGTMSQANVMVDDVTVTQTTVRVALQRESGDIPGVQTSHAQTYVLNSAEVDGLFVMGFERSIDGLIRDLRNEQPMVESVRSLVEETADLSSLPDGDLLLHFCPAVLDTLLQSASNSSGVNLSALGFSDVEGTSVVFDFSPETTQMWGIVSLVPQPVGVGRLFTHGGESDFPALDWVPENVASLTCDNVDIPALFRDIRLILRRVSPQIDMMASSVLITLNQSLGFDIEHDLIASMGSDVISFTVENDTQGNPYAAPMSTVALMELSDPARVESILAALAQPTTPGSAQLMGSGPVLEERDFNGQSFYSPPALFAGPMAGAPIPAFAVIEGQLVFCSTIPQLQSLISSRQDGAATSVRDSTLWAQIQEHSLPGASSFGYQDDVAVMTAMAQSVQQMGMMFLLMPDVSPPVDFTSVPTADVFERHMTHTFSSSRHTARGLVYHSWSPNE